jgi:hypothetical protein
MMRQVFKYQFDANSGDEGTVELPQGATIVDAKLVGDDPTNWFIWALVSAENPMEARHFRVCGTGHLLPSNVKHVATAHHPPFVWHLFEIR